MRKQLRKVRLNWSQPDREENTDESFRYTFAINRLVLFFYYHPPRSTMYFEANEDFCFSENTVRQHERERRAGKVLQGVADCAAAPRIHGDSAPGRVGRDETVGVVRIESGPVRFASTVALSVAEQQLDLFSFCFPNWRYLGKIIFIIFVYFVV